MHYTSLESQIKDISINVFVSKIFNVRLFIWSINEDQ